MEAIKRILAPAGSVAGALVVIAGYILDGIGAASLGLPFWAWQAIGAGIFFFSVMTVLYGQEKRFSTAAPNQTVPSHDNQPVTHSEGPEHDDQNADDCRRLSAMEKLQIQKWYDGFISAIDNVDCTNVLEISPSLRVIIVIRNYLVFEVELEDFKFNNAGFTYPAGSACKSFGPIRELNGHMIPAFDGWKFEAVISINDAVKAVLKSASDASEEVAYDFKVQWNARFKGAPRSHISDLKFKGVPNVPPEKGQRGEMGI